MKLGLLHGESAKRDQSKANSCIHFSAKRSNKDLSLAIMFIRFFAKSQEPFFNGNQDL